MCGRGGGGDVCVWDEGIIDGQSAFSFHTIKLPPTNEMYTRVLFP